MKKFIQNGHWELWEWCADNPGKEKKDWPGWCCFPRQLNDCFACGYAEGDCSRCPLGGRDNQGHCLLGLVRAWNREKNPVRKSQFAMAIRNIPVNDGVEVEYI